MEGFPDRVRFSIPLPSRSYIDGTERNSTITIAS